MTASRNPLTKWSVNGPLLPLQVEANFASCMRWAGPWNSGDTYEANQVVMNNGALLIANTTTNATPDPAHTDWDFLAWLPNQAWLNGSPTNNAPGTSFTAITGWPDSGAYGVFEQTPPNPATGIITCPIASVLKITPKIILTQGNNNKELAYLFWIRGSVSGDNVWDVFDVATDKTTYRAAGGAFSINAAAGETFQLGYSWNGDSSPGTSNFYPCLFEVEMTLPVAFQA